MDLNQTIQLDTCRVCLEKSSKLYPLEGPILNVDVYVSTMISYCTSIEIELEADLPTGICMPCFRTVRIAYNFIKQFKETNKKLLEQREMNKMKIIHNSEEYNDNHQGLLELKQEPFYAAQLKNCNYDFQENTCVSEINKTEDNIQLSKYEGIILSDSEEDVQLDKKYVQNLVETSPNLMNFVREENIIVMYSNDNSDCSDGPTSLAEIVSESNEKMYENEDLVSKTEQNSTLPNKSIIFNKYTCPLCFSGFINFHKGLVKHLQRCHKDDSFKCNKCSLDIKLSVELYVQHYTNTHLYQCPVCPRRLGSKSSFYYHIRNHGKPTNSWQCPDVNCAKTFLTKLRLRKHMDTHSETPNYVCSKCGKKFNTYDTFRYHNETHDGNRNHLCTVCGRAFLQSAHLKYHMWHHTGVKQFKCEDCDKTYTTASQLKKHRRKHCGCVKPEVD